ncbi:50S ribosomal protein L30e [Candidatus Micrarchaeota archaeon CG_4_10_14_0_2_um_filter_55_9]|nr:MAG: 50S ribosomal protein L30e [Candidatus Micrarchaeota archaeon CG09_land_8_20_14_0_10_55_25]PIZ91838.1 MAG: 50S ribosomal protein L30e [Candidatus Micrarchaeota archaeon CG_4_10_14_0_2_um_filter_55_9]PJD01551.1 MAG: 50S ribosomal protein L30e [Candidatus Micrarchaeota archaeon CG10_big_fil_rev_8_21_14_0_10_54_18]
MDLSKNVRLCVDSGKAELGSKKAFKLLLGGEAKLLILSGNCPEEAARDLRHAAKLANVNVADFSGTSLELGVACGKPFPVSAFTVLEAGDSELGLLY